MHDVLDTSPSWQKFCNINDEWDFRAVCTFIGKQHRLNSLRCYRKIQIVFLDAQFRDRHIGLM